MAEDSKFDPKKLEEMVLAGWDHSNAYSKWKSRQKGRPACFAFIDGPPFPTGKIHVGTAWNKSMKDTILRYKAMTGFRVNDTPGYDMHGLPVELKVERELKIKNKKEIEEVYGIGEFVKRCREFAGKNLDVMSGQFRRLGVWMDWEHPYKTTEDYYIEGCWWAIKKAREKNLLYQGKKVITVCPRCETAIAKHEQEYKTVKENSVYVKFPLAGNKPGEYIVIWTTTPWTLPTNMAVMVHPDLEYVRARVGGEGWLLAKGLANALFGVLGLNYEIIETVKGRDLEGLKYRHPLEDEVPIHKQFDKDVKNVHTIVLSEEYVSLDSGSGCVHCAPGTGPEDFEVGARNGIPPFCPIELSGKFTADGGKYAGLYAKKNCDPAVVEDLKAKGLLVHQVEVEHEYPACWRCKTALLFLSTDQWFLATSKLKEQMLEENKAVKWIPDWAGEKWFSSWLHGLQDWCISKQRYWGVPLPIWLCEKCGTVEVIGTIAELGSKTAIPAGQDLHRPGIDKITWACQKCKKGTMRRVPDILDVWVESGAAVWASQKYPSSGSPSFPADFIIEGKDQIRGWFYSLMGLSTIAFGRAPYKAVYMHGMTNDEQGRKFSKSLGNFVSPEEVIGKYGSEPFRFFAIGAAAPGEDITYGHRYVAEAFTDLSVLWNSYMFAAKYMALDHYSPRAEAPKNLQIEDRWIISRVNTLTKEVTEALEGYELPKIPKLLKKFFVDDLSRWYIKLIRDRTWVTAPKEDKEAAYFALYYSLDRLLKLLAPVIPMLSEAIHQRFTKVLDPNASESVHFLDWPASEDNLRDDNIEEDMEVAKAIVEASMMARDKAKIKLRWPVREILVEPVEFQESVKRMNESGDTRGLNHGNVVSVQKVLSSPKGVEIPKQDSQFHHSLGRTDVKHLPPIIQNFSPIICRLCNSKSVEIGKPTEISKYESVHIVGLSVHLLKERDAELINESVLRELSRKVQSIRKEQGLDVSDRIELSLSAPEEIRKIVVKATGAEFKNKIGAEKVTFVPDELATKDELETEKGKVRLKVEKI